MQSPTAAETSTHPLPPAYKQYISVFVPPPPPLNTLRPRYSFELEGGGEPMLQLLLITASAGIGKSNAPN